MSRLRLTLAVGDYDVTRPLIDGAVQPSGLDLVVVTYPSPQRHWRMMRHREFDACELSLGSYVTHRGSGGEDLVAVPAFPHRRFRHGYLFVPAASPAREPAELSGGSIGIRTWQTTAGIWLRGILAEHHGLDLASVRWIAQDAEDVADSVPSDIDLRRVEEGQSVTELCATGALDGLVYPEIPRQVLDRDGTIRRLFDDPKAEEQAYFGRTGIFPIMHTVALQSDLVERFPWVARSLLDAFVEAKRLAIARLDNPRTVSLAWLRALQEEERDILGADPWRYGFDDVNRATLSTFLRYALDQGLVKQPLQPEDLFYDTTLDDVPSYV